MTIPEKIPGGGIQMLKIPTLIKRFCDALLEYDSETGRIFWYHNDRRPELCDAWSDYKDIYQLYRECYVCSDDLEIWDHFMKPDHMQHFVKGETAESHFYIRFENRGKGMEWHEIFMEKMEDSKVLIGSRDIRGIQRSAAVTQAVLPQFDYVCFIDTETEGYVLYSQDASKTVLPESTSGDYHEVIKKFNRKYVVLEEAGSLTEHMKIGRVQQELQEKEEYILYATFKDQEKIFYKKLYFSYADATRKKLILIRTDVSDIVKERKLREREERKRIAYLEHMPVACVSAKVLLDEDGDPYDFRLTYSNQAYAKLMETELQELLKKNFYEIFPKADRKRLKYYYETAYKGIAHVISCQELQKSREEIQRVLATTTDLVFQYCPETHEISLTRIGREEKHQIIPETVLIQKLTDRKWLESSCVAVLENGFRRMREGEHYLSVNLKARFGNTEKWTWYRMTMFDFQAEDTHERKIFGYLQNIHQDMMKQEKLKKKAQIDPLTRVLNAGAGRQNIQKLLENQGEKPKGYHAMFLMDIDDFKKINDTCGHLLGNRVLEIFGRTLRKTFRKEDIIYRLGGDEFVVFVKNMENPDRTIRSIMQRLNSHLGEMKKAYTYFSSSTGVYVTKERCSFEQYYTEADRALYETKKQGKGHYTIRGEME